MVNTNELRTYQQWIGCLDYLSKKKVTDEFIDKLKYGLCPGIEMVMPHFLERVQDTVNQMMDRSTRICTALLNESLEDGDFSNVEANLYRCYRDIKRCRFYLNIKFIPESFVIELDEKTVSETNRYWKEVHKVLTQLAEETGNEEIYDLLYYMNRLIKKDRRNG